MLFLLPIVLAAPSVLAAATPGMSLLTRQVTPTADCVSACTPLEDATLAADGSIASLCTNAMISDYVQCYNCLITADAITQSSAQTTVDGLVLSCASAGFPVKDGTVSGGSSGSNTGTGSGTTLGSGAGSESSSTAGAATSESTSTAGSSGSSSTSSSSGSSGSSSGSSNSDSGSAASGDSSSGSGLGSGGGFKTNSGLRLGAVPVSLLISLSVLCMWNL